MGGDTLMCDYSWNPPEPLRRNMTIYEQIHYGIIEIDLVQEVERSLVHEISEEIRDSQYQTGYSAGYQSGYDDGRQAEYLDCMIGWREV